MVVSLEILNFDIDTNIDILKFKYCIEASKKLFTTKLDLDCNGEKTIFELIGFVEQLKFENFFWRNIPKRIYSDINLFKEIK